MAGKSQFGSRPPSPRVDRRRAKRDRLGMAVSLYSVSQSRVVLMVDVSPTGAGIAAQDLPGVGKDVLLKVGDLELFGRLVRAANGEAGIEFDRPISPRDLEVLQAALAEQTRTAMLHVR